MPNYNITISDGNREGVLEYIQTQRKQYGQTFRVVDVGASYNGWSLNVVDAIIDFNDPPNNKTIKHFKMDITHPDSWNGVLEYVDTMGKFDFCICTHTLEDIMNPGFVCEQISKIAHAGYIAVPSKYKELARFERNSYGHTYKGYIHHRWIFNMEDGVFVGYPKINYVENNSIFDTIADNDNRRSDLSFYWKDRIDIRYLNHNFLGPNVDAVIGYYHRLLL